MLNKKVLQLNITALGRVAIALGVYLLGIGATGIVNQAARLRKEISDECFFVARGRSQTSGISSVAGSWISRQKRCGCEVQRCEFASHVLRYVLWCVRPWCVCWFVGKRAVGLWAFVFVSKNLNMWCRIDFA